MHYVNECTFKRCFIKHRFFTLKPLIRGTEFCFLHAKLVTKSGKEILVEKKIVLDEVILPLAQCAETETETENLCVFVRGREENLKIGSHKVTLANFKLRDPTCLLPPKGSATTSSLFFETKFRLAFNSNVYLQSTRIKGTGHHIL